MEAEPGTYARLGNHQLEDRQLQTQPEEEREHDRREQCTEHAALQFRRLALLLSDGNPIPEKRGKIRHDHSFSGRLRNDPL